MTRLEYILKTEVYLTNLKRPRWIPDNYHHEDLDFDRDGVKVIIPYKSYVHLWKTSFDNLKDKLAMYRLESTENINNLTALIINGAQGEKYFTS